MLVKNAVNQFKNAQKTTTATEFDVVEVVPRWHEAIFDKEFEGRPNPFNTGLMRVMINAMFMGDPCRGVHGAVVRIRIARGLSSASRAFHRSIRFLSRSSFGHLHKTSSWQPATLCLHDPVSCIKNQGSSP